MASPNLQTFLPLILEITADLADGKIDAAERARLIEKIAPLVLLLMAPSAPAPAPTPVPVPPPVPTPAPAPMPAPTGKLRIVRLKAKVSSIYGRDNVTGVGEAATQNVLAGGNLDNGWHVHTDCTPILEDGSELGPGDPRWANVHRWSPNKSALWPVYEYDGQVTDIRKGDHGSPYVNPKSFADDEHCTVTFEVDTPEPHNTQHTWRFGYISQNEDGSWVESGMIGQGNVAGGAPFTVR